MSINKNIKQLNKDSKNIKLFLKYLPCFFKGFLIIVIGILVLSFAYYKLSEHSPIIYYISYLFFAFGGFVSGNSLHKKVGGRGILTGTLGALPVALLIYLAIALISINNLSIFSLICPLICIVGGTSGGIVSSNTKKRY